MVKKNYKQFCGLAKALNLIGERWTLLVARNLLLGPARYSELLAGLPGITTNLLAARLAAMQEHGIVKKFDGAYELDQVGLELEPAVMALGQWGSRYLKEGPKRGDKLDLAWAVVALRRRFKATGSTWVVELVASSQVFQLTQRDGRLETRRGRPRLADVVARGEDAAWRALFLEGASAERLLKDHALRFEGTWDWRSASTWSDFLKAFTFTS